MNRLFLNSIAIAVVSLAATQPSAAHESTSEAPVSVLACKTVMNYAPVSEGEQGQRSMPTGVTVQIAFVSRSAQTATDITFLVGDQPITFEGQFFNGIPIKHTFGPYNTVNDHDTCKVSSVKFDDGRMWQRP